MCVSPYKRIRMFARLVKKLFMYVMQKFGSFIHLTSSGVQHILEQLRKTLIRKPKVNRLVQFTSTSYDWTNEPGLRHGAVLTSD